MRQNVTAARKSPQNSHRFGPRDDRTRARNVHQTDGVRCEFLRFLKMKRRSAYRRRGICRLPRKNQSVTWTIGLIHFSDNPTRVEKMRRVIRITALCRSLPGEVMQLHDFTKSATGIYRGRIGSRVER